MRITKLSFSFLTLASPLLAQEARTGIDLRATITGQAAWADQLGSPPRQGSQWAPGVRAVLYPTIKLNDHWSVSGAIQAVSRPYYTDDFTSVGHGVRARVLQAHISYTRTWGSGAVVIRAGQMVSAFGSFLLRYDDADNALTGMPQAYGYYKPVSSLGLAGAEADVTVGKWDGRLQFASSSPANPRSVFDKDQYANWAGGFGYTIRQGLRIGGSGYRGPYLDRHHPYYFPGEAPPRQLSATGIGIDGEWARAAWNVRGEWQRFVLPYRAIPDYRLTSGYVEARRVLHPRWFVAARVGRLQTNYYSGGDAYEGSVGFRPGSQQLLKAGYVVARAQSDGKLDKVLVLQMVSVIHPFSRGWR